MQHNYEQQMIVPYAADHLVDIVLNVEDYPLFLSWCTSSKILSGNRDNMEAELVIAWNGLGTKYISKVAYTAQGALHNIDIQAISGPFKQLSSRWIFRELGAAETEVYFSMQLEMKSYLVNKLVGQVFTQLAADTSTAFTNRLHSI